MQKQFKSYVLLGLVAFAFSLESANKSFLKKEANIILAQTGNKETTASALNLNNQRTSCYRGSHHPSRREETDSLGMRKKDFECLEKDDFFRGGRDGQEQQADDYYGCRGGDRDRRHARKLRASRNNERRADRIRSHKKPCSRVETEEKSEPEGLKPTTESPKEGDEVQPSEPVAPTVTPVVEQEGGEAVIDEKPKDDKPKLTVVGSDKDGDNSQGEQQGTDNQKELCAVISDKGIKSRIKTPDAQLKIVVTPAPCDSDSEPKEQVIEKTTPEGGKAVEKLYQQRKSDESKPGEKSCSNVLKQSKSESFSKCSGSSSSSSSDSSEPKLRGAGPKPDEELQPELQPEQPELQPEQPESRPEPQPEQPEQPEPTPEPQGEVKTSKKCDCN